MKLHPSIYLEYGADESTCEDQEFEICEHGMCFQSRWQFEIGTEFRVSFSYDGREGVSRRISAEGMIVDCEAQCPRCYKVTLLFVNPGDDLRAAIRDVSGSLEATVGEQAAMSRRLPG